MTGACGETATSAGCASIIPADTKNPGYEMPHMPTRPLLQGTCFTSQSTVSHVSVLSSVSVFADFAGLCDRTSTHSPSDM